LNLKKTLRKKEKVNFYKSMIFYIITFDYSKNNEIFFFLFYMSFAVLKRTILNEFKLIND